MKSAKKIYFIIGFSALLFPWILSFTSINQADFYSLTLQNDERKEKPTFDWSYLFGDSLEVKKEWNGSIYRKADWNTRDSLIENYFNQLSDYYNSRFGLRALYVRARNQIDYTLFNKANANSVVIGKEGFLFEDTYIDSYYGKDFIGHQAVEARVDSLQKIQKILNASGKYMLVVIAPGKGFYYPEYIPESLKSEKTTTNYEVYKSELEKKGVEFIDFNGYFLENKNKSEHTLYPKTGIHWSQAAVYDVLDSLVNKIESNTNFDLPEISIGGQEKLERSIGYQDDDIELGMNLLFDMEHLPMSYPKLKFGSKEGKSKVKALTISDSFFWQIYKLGVRDSLFHTNDFWFYNNAIYPESDLSGRFVFTHEKNILNELMQNDVIILMTTEANLYKFPFGFSKTAYPELVTGFEQYEKRIAEILQSMRDNEDWLKKINEKAIEKGISLEEMMQLDADYIYENNK